MTHSPIKLKYAHLDQAWQAEVVDTSEQEVGADLSLALDNQGRPHISYCAYPSLWRAIGLKYAHFDGNSWQIETVDSGAIVAYTSLALDADGHPHISYCFSDSPGENCHGLRYAHWDGVSWQTETIDSGTSVGSFTSLALDSAGQPHIGYGDPYHGYLKYAHFDGTAWQIETVGGGGRAISLALDSSDRPHISYEGNDSGLKYTYSDGTTWHTQAVAADVYGRRTSLALNATGQPHFSYQKRGFYSEYLQYTYFDYPFQVDETVDYDESVGSYSSLVLDRNGRPHISYNDEPDGDLRYAYFDGTSWQIETVDSAGYVGEYTSLALDAAGRPHISYFDQNSGDLKYAWGEEGVPIEYKVYLPMVVR